MTASMPRRLLAALALALIFLRELWLSAVTVARAAFAREVKLSPAIVAVPLDLRTPLGVATVANLVSLTPGTTSLHASADGRVLYVHAMDIGDEAELVRSIRDVFERRVSQVEGRP